MFSKNAVNNVSLGVYGAKLISLPLKSEKEIQKYVKKSES
jgi:hypothetical protein